MYLNENAILLLEGIIKDINSLNIFRNPENQKKFFNKSQSLLNDYLKNDENIKKLAGPKIKRVERGKMTFDELRDRVKRNYQFNPEKGIEDVQSTLLNVQKKDPEFLNFIKNNYKEDFSQIDAPDHKKIEVFDVGPKFLGRDTVIARADNHVIPFYKSTGANGVKDAWLPFAGILTEKHPLRQDYPDYATNQWFIKNALAASKGQPTYEALIGNYFGPQDYKYRTMPFGRFPVNIRQIADELNKQGVYSDKTTENPYEINNAIMNAIEKSRKL